MPGPEIVNSPPPESIRDILGRVGQAASRLNQDGLSQEQIGQAVNTVLGGAITLHNRGEVGRNAAICNFLQSVFTPDPQHRILADTLVAVIEKKANAANNPQAVSAVRSLLELSSYLGINDKEKYPDLVPRLDTISAPEKSPRRKKGVVKKDPGSGDFIPLADNVEPEEPDVTQSALLVAFRDVIGYLLDTPDNRDMLEQAAEGNPQALLKLAKLAAGRGYLKRAVQGLARLNAQYPDRAEEIIPILEALSASEPNNPGVYQLLGDSYLQLGQHKEAIAEYGEMLKIPPRE